MAALSKEAQKEFDLYVAQQAKYEGKDPKTLAQEIHAQVPNEVLEVKFNPKSPDFTAHFDQQQAHIEEQDKKSRLQPTQYSPSKPRPELTLEQKEKFDKDLTLFIEKEFGPEKAHDDDFRAKVAATLALTMAKKLDNELDEEAFENYKVQTNNPELTMRDYIAMERMGMNPDVEARLRHLLAMNGVMQQEDILYGQEVPPDIRQKFELLGNNPHGETLYGQSMRNLGIDESAVSLVKDQNLQQQSPNLNDVYKNYQAGPQPSKPGMSR